MVRSGGRLHEPDKPATERKRKNLIHKLSICADVDRPVAFSPMIVGLTSNVLGEWTLMIRRNYIKQWLVQEFHTNDTLGSWLPVAVLFGQHQCSYMI